MRNSSRLSEPDPERRGGCGGGDVGWRGGVRARAALIVSQHGDKVIGPRFIRLLEAIGTAGSVRGAAATLGLGYRHAIAWIRRAEALVGRSLVERHAGGTAGGGSALTPEALRLITAYHRVGRRLSRVVARAEQEILG